MSLTNPNHVPNGAIRNPGFRGRKWRPAAVCIAGGMTNKATAEKVGVHEVTIARWRRSDKFKNYVNRVHDEAVEAAVGKLATTMTKAADVIAALLDSPSEHVRLQATDRVKDWVKHFRNDKLILAKLESLEQKLPTALVPVNDPQ